MFAVFQDVMLLQLSLATRLFVSHLHVLQTTVESQFLEPPREMNIGLKYWKIALFD